MRLMAQNVKLKPNAHMRHLLKMQCGYRRYCYNHGLAYWNDAYTAHCWNHQNLTPNGRRVRNYLVYNKLDWQFTMSSRVLQYAIRDLKNAFKAFFDKKRPDMHHPHFYSKKRPKQSFKTDKAKIVNGKLRLDRARMYPKSEFYDIRMEGFRPFYGKLKLVNVREIRGQFIATLFYSNDENQVTVYTNRKTAVDVNVGHFNYAKGTPKHISFGECYVLPRKLQRYYKRNKHYQRMLARKRRVNPHTFNQSESYYKIRVKLQRCYDRISHIQHDILQKFTTHLVTHFDTIVIEDLDIKHMMMSHVASKGMQRSMFGRFRRELTYKCKWFGKHLILANRYYPSTQLCSKCGYRKTGADKITLCGNKRHHTNHHQFICYHCGFHADRDNNAVLNLLKLA